MIGVINMPRPPKIRNIKNIPEITFFKPAGIPMRDLEEEHLKMEEVEAIRLKDLKNLTQQECAEKMKISRPTFHRILVSAREKIARGLIQGKGIRFKGGEYRLIGKYKCKNCGAIVNFSSTPHRHRHGKNRGNSKTCPKCDSPSLEHLDENNNNS